MILSQFLDDNDLEAHIDKIIDVYGKRKNIMVDAMKKYFRRSYLHQSRRRGLFPVGKLTRRLKMLATSQKAIEKKVAFVLPAALSIPKARKKTTSA